jgi:hypothetical protein
MNKKVLALYYSQSGQLEEILNNFAAPLIAAGVSVEKVHIQPEKPFVFPWTSERFFDAMPESVLGTPVPLAPFELNEEDYDLVILAYQPWYLSPSIPTTSMLLHPKIRKVIANKPVITLIGSRNMWLNAQEKVKKYLEEVNADLVGNVALFDRNNNSVSAVTILYWMLTGKKDRMWGIFPKPGVADEDVVQVGTYGAIVLEILENGNWDALQEQLVSAKAVEVKSNLMFIEHRAKRLFAIWANLITKRKNRALWLKIFKYYLVIALFIVAPIVVTINTIFFKPFLQKKIQRKKQYYLAVN